MVVRIRITRGTSVAGLKPAISSVLTLVAVVCFIVGIWILCAGLGWAGSFVLRSGVLSHWQIWMGIGVAAQLCSFRLNRPVAWRGQS
ncbi:MAG: hypothetical protein JWO80_1488 [Bryobacterales bacterium]|nr:hypothetical protein [Bryobacterales bacterium]